MLLNLQVLLSYESQLQSDIAVSFKPNSVQVFPFKFESSI